MKPRSSSTLVFSRPMLSVLGLRPTATRSFSAWSCSCLPSLVVMVRVTPSAVFLMFSARARFDADLLLFEIALKLLGDVFVFDGHDAREHLDDGDIGAEAFEDGCEL